MRARDAKKLRFLPPVTQALCTKGNIKTLVCPASSNKKIIGITMKKIMLFLIGGFYLCGLSFVAQGEALQKEISGFSHVPKLVKK
jgi:hypothetical protein